MKTLREKIEGLPFVAMASGRQIYGAVDKEKVLGIVAEHEAEQIDRYGYEAQIEWLKQSTGSLVNPDDETDGVSGATIAGWLAYLLRKIPPTIPYMTPVGAGRCEAVSKTPRACGNPLPCAVHNAPVDQAPQVSQRGLPSAALRKAWSEWEVTFKRWPYSTNRITFNKGGDRFHLHIGTWSTDQYEPVSEHPFTDDIFKPHGKTWAEVEQMAAGSELWRRELGQLAVLRAMKTGSGGLTDAEAGRGALLQILDRLTEVIHSSTCQAPVPPGVIALLGVSEGKWMAHAAVKEGLGDGVRITLETEFTRSSVWFPIAEFTAAMNAYGNSLVGAK